MVKKIAFFSGGNNFLRHGLLRCPAAGKHPLDHIGRGSDPLQVFLFFQGHTSIGKLFPFERKLTGPSCRPGHILRLEISKNRTLILLVGVSHTICPRRPVCRPKPGKSSSGGVLHRLTGVSPQLPFWQSRPHCLRLWLDGSTIVIPTVIAIPGATLYSQRGFSLGPVNRGSWRTLLLWLALSRIGTDVLDEWVFGFQGAWRGG